jgi:hypothetical protein
MISRTNRYWSRTDIYTASYLNGRNQAFQHDADGRIKQDEDNQYNYDAAGRNTSVITIFEQRTVSQVHDGDGLVVKRVSPSFYIDYPPEVNYYLRSTVLGGLAINELNSAGQKMLGHVYAGGEELALQSAGQVFWEHRNPVTESRGRSLSSGFGGPTVEADPVGISVGYEDPYVQPPGGNNSLDMELPGLLPTAPSGHCTMDNVPFFCASVLRFVGIGAATFGPTEQQTMLRFRDRETGAIQYALSRWVVNGQGAGYLPVGARMYEGGHVWQVTLGYSAGIEEIGSGTRPYNPGGGFSEMFFQQGSVPRLGGNPTQGQRSILAGAYREMLKRLKKKCIDALGGEEKVNEALKKAKYKVGDLGRPSNTEEDIDPLTGQGTPRVSDFYHPTGNVAEVNRSGVVTLNSYGDFFIRNNTLRGRGGKTYNFPAAYIRLFPTFTLGTLNFANDTLVGAFILLHEIAHVAGTNQGDFNLNAQSDHNELILNNCFDLTTTTDLYDQPVTSVR